MPYKFETDKLKIPKKYDRRIKLSEEQRKEIKKHYGKISQRKLAKAFEVSRRLIQLIGEPEKAKRQKELFKIRQSDGRYYNKEKERKYMLKHRQYKKKLYEENKLTKEE